MKDYRKIFAILSILAVFFGTLRGQVQTWEELGPNNFGGRVTALAISPQNHIYVGSAGGGLWRSTDFGYTWYRVTGFNDNQIVSHIYIDGNNIYVSTGDLVRNAYIRWGSNANFNNNRISNYAAGFWGFSGRPGKGVYVSTDGGNTFSNANATWDANCTDPAQSCFYDPIANPFISVQKVVKDKNGRIYVGTYSGLYFSDDNLATLTKATLIDTSGNDQSNQAIIDIEVTNNRVYVATVGNPANVFVQDNFTGNFNSINNKINFLFSSSNRPVRLEISIAPSDENYVYIGCVTTITKLGFSGVALSKDGGNNFERIAPPSTPGFFVPIADGTGWYSMCMAVDPQDKDRLLLGGSTYWEYHDTSGWFAAGNTSHLDYFLENSYSGVFINNIVFNMDPAWKGQVWYSGVREVIMSQDNGRTFQIRTKALNTANINDAKFGGGTLDIFAVANELGYIYRDYPSVYSQEFATKRISTKLNGRIFNSTINPDWVLGSGEGGEVLSRSTNKGSLFENFYGYPRKDSCGMSPHPTISDTLVSGSTPVPSFQSVFTYIEHPTQSPTVDGDGFHYLVQDASGKKYYQNFAFVPNYLHTSIWLVSNPFGGPDSLPTWTKLSLTDINEGESDDRLTAITVSRDGNFTLYAATRKGRLWRITNANDLCNRQMTKISNGLPSRWITSIAIHPNDPNTVLVTYGSYDFANQSNGRIYVTNDALSASPTFRDVTGNFPKYPVYCALFAPTTTIASPRNWKVLIGTEIGVYASDDDLTNPTVTNPTWNDYNHPSMKNTPVVSLDMKWWNRRVVTNGNNTEIYLDEAKDKHVIAGTQGRGVFLLRDWTVSRDKSQNDFNSNLSITAFPNPANKQIFLKVDNQLQGIYELLLMDVQGKALIQNKLLIEKGTQIIELNAEELPAGIYFIKLHNANNSQATKIIIEK